MYLTSNDASIVVSARNESANLPGLLQSLREYSPLSEVIVVDNRSTDNTYEIAKSFGAIALRCDGTLVEARRSGFALASRQYIIVLDADHRVGPDTINSALNLAYETKADSIVLPERPYEGRSIYQRTVGLERRLSEAGSVAIPRVFTRRHLIDHLLADPATVFGEDWRLRSKNHLPPMSTALLFHRELETFRKALQKYYLYGKRGGIDVELGPRLVGFHKGVWAILREDRCRCLPLIGIVAGLKLGKAAALYAGQIQRRLSRYGANVELCRLAQPKSER